LTQPLNAPLPVQPIICIRASLFTAAVEHAATVDRSAGKAVSVGASVKQLPVPLPSYVTSRPFVSVPPSPKALLRMMLRSSETASGCSVSRMPSIAAMPVRKLP
jgi:hypothetical protein